LGGRVRAQDPESTFRGTVVLTVQLAPAAVKAAVVQAMRGRAVGWDARERASLSCFRVMV